MQQNESKTDRGRWEAAEGAGEGDRARAHRREKSVETRATRATSAMSSSASTSSHSSDKRLQYQLFYQMSRITRGRGSLAHDDRLDVLSMAVGYWVQQMAQDADRRISVRKGEMLDRELERFMESAIGRKDRGGDTWVSL